MVTTYNCFQQGDMCIIMCEKYQQAGLCRYAENFRRFRWIPPASKTIRLVTIWKRKNTIRIKPNYSYFKWSINFNEVNRVRSQRWVNANAPRWGKLEAGRYRLQLTKLLIIRKFACPEILICIFAQHHDLGPATPTALKLKASNKFINIKNTTL